ncbi:MAG: mechanosensitive ion channel [Rickettsiaceae bacterium]|nr:mechanosensitive ion channel [Rickettsiaceae bacterium]
MEQLYALKYLFNMDGDSGNVFILIAVMLLAFYPLYFIIKRIISPVVHKAIKEKKVNYTEIFNKHKVSNKLVHVFISIYLVFWGQVFDKANLLPLAINHVKDTILVVYSTIFITLFINAMISVFVDVYRTKSVSRKIPIGLHSHIIKIIIAVCAFLIIISHVLTISVSSIFASLGAAAALLTFVFKDTVLGLLASLQLTFQDIIRVGDWVTVPSYNADGDVELITITVVRIRNFDKTVTTVPTSALLSTGVKNWRAMQESGGRRIKRSVSLDIDTVKFCEQKQLDKFKKMDVMSSFAKEAPELFVAKNKVSNLAIFRHYINQYLKHNQAIHQEGFTFLIRQLEPTATGVPIELYVFTNDTNWVKYEDIQSGIFDHILAVLPEFNLKAFQTVVQN